MTKKKLNSNTWKATADFAEHMNNVIDACNSYSLNVKFGGKRPLSRKNPDIENLLTNFVQWSLGWSKFSDRIYQVPCFKDFAITTQAILALYKELASKNVKDLNLQQVYATKIQLHIYFQNFGNAEDLILIQPQEWSDYQSDIYFPHSNER